MAAPLQPFESSWEKKAKKQEVREARERYLAKVKKDYERRKTKEDDAKARGEGNWMLPSLTDRIDREAKELAKSKKEKKKKKKQKKEKKHKKNKKKHGNSSDDSNSDSDEEQEWVEKTSTAAPSVQGPKLERDSWMMAPVDLFGGVTREDIRAQKRKENGEEEEKKSIIDQLGQHERELNPYWKDGGTGLPEELQEEKTRKQSKESKESSPRVMTGDGGLSWLRKALQRCTEIATEEGCTVEQVAAERYGSLKELKAKLKEAEKKASALRLGGSRDQNHERYRDRESGKGLSRGLRGLSGRFMKPGDGESRRDAYRSPSLQSSQPTWKKTGFQKPNLDDDEGPKKQRPGFLKPGEGRSSPPQSRASGSGWRKDLPERSRRSRSRSRERKRSRSREKHQSKSKSPERRRSRSKERHESRSQSGDKRSRSIERSQCKERKQRSEERDRSRSRDRNMGSRKKSRSRSHSRERMTSSDSSKDSDSDSSSGESSDSDGDDKSMDHQPTEPQPIVILTEDQMNALAARILKAELMGNEEMASKLRTELEDARKAKEAGPRAAGGQQVKRPQVSDEDKVVVLTRTDRSGMVRPVSQTGHDGATEGRRKKKQKVATHGRDGERERYFADDDKHSLKSLVQREKMSTAEDANQMFARLAGRAVEKTDDEYQLDDVLVNRASKKMTDMESEQKDRSMAIFEHRKLTSALEKCPHCFDNVPKHLIVAIGIKCYLCVPNHRSIVPGHCLIIPMQHVTSGTMVDEDVWAEIQVFRKGLTRMFEAQEEDTVFMETVKNLRYHPHMVVECIPMPRETGEMAPIYFKKAIQECDTEWSQNKKVVDLSKKDVRHSIPKGFPYFSVDFGLQGGFAHVIEDEKIFPSYFGREIVGGMMDLEPQLWRKPHREEFEQQREKVLQFATWWKPYDWTERLKSSLDSDD